MLPLLLGHRGARATKSVSENTIESFDLALQHGCDGFEFDVRLTSDSFPVICHDAQFCGSNIARANRSDLNLTLLEDVVARYAQQAFLDIELKVVGLEDAVLAALRRHVPERFVVSSFLPQILSALRSRDSRLPLGFICDRADHLRRWPELPVQYVIPRHDLVHRNLIKEVHDSGKSVFVWTVNERDAMRRFADCGVDAIISDDTELLVGILKGKLA
ncbi:MAG: glycerophosphodiester phosphodiesterase [Acidobacteria bacterium]|nr:MAG: glycerophosphodiester phosphodiesterase [Acidobacteriota bacterium]